MWVGIGSRFLFIVCVLIHLLLTLNEFLGEEHSPRVHLQDVSIAAEPVFQEFQLYRLVSSAFVHSDFWHLLTNMSALISIGPRLEKHCGSLVFLFLSCAIILFTNVLYCAVCYGMYFTVWATSGFSESSSDAWIHYHAVGLSGLLFSLMVIALSIQPNEFITNSNTFGLSTYFNDSRYIVRMYPWMIMVVVQVIFTKSSWLGHLVGISVGHLATYGVFDMILPSAHRISGLEQACTSSSSERTCTCLGIPQALIESAMYARCQERPYLIQSMTPALNGEGIWTGRTAFENDKKMVRAAGGILCAPAMYYWKKIVQLRSSPSESSV